MMDPNTYFSRAARALRESAIRRAGDLAGRRPDLVSLAPGFPDSSLFAWDEFRDIAHSVLSGADGSALQYGPTRGYLPLRAALPDMLAERGIETTIDHTIVTTGSQQGLDLCARVFVNPGDVVVVELPTYTGGITAFGNAQAELVGVPQDEAGIDINALDATVARERAAGKRIALVYVIPSFHNPTGVLMTLQRRHELLEWAGRHDVLIVEDDPYGALYFTDVASEGDTRPIKADDEEGRVVYLSSFSKTVAPGFRVAWIAAAAPFVEKLEIAKQTADLCSSSLDQRIIFEVWRRGALTRRLPLLRDRYQGKRTAMETALAREFGSLVSWIEPKGGFFIWATFPEGIDTDTLLVRALEHGVAYVPGSAFFVANRDPRLARLAFSASTHEQIETGIARLARALSSALDSLKELEPAPPARDSAAQQTPRARVRSIA